MDEHRVKSVLRLQSKGPGKRAPHRLVVLVLQIGNRQTATGHGWAESTRCRKRRQLGAECEGSPLKGVMKHTRTCTEALTPPRPHSTWLPSCPRHQLPTPMPHPRDTVASPLRATCGMPHPTRTPWPSCLSSLSPSPRCPRLHPARHSLPQPTCSCTISLCRSPSRGGAGSCAAAAASVAACAVACASGVGAAATVATSAGLGAPARSKVG